jgi:hypothetical protein
MTGFESKRQAAQNKMNDAADTLSIVYQRGFADGKKAAQPEQEPVAYDKTELNRFVQDLYDEKMQEGKHGHYETMFHVVHQAIKKVAPPKQQAEPCIGKDPRCPCQDGDACHYKDCGNTKARPVAQPEQGPVAWAVQGCSKMWRDEFAEIDAKRIGGTCVAYALYTTPPAAQRPWQGLTDDEMSDAVADMEVDFGDLLWKVVCLTKLIEAKLKERNGY